MEHYGKILEVLPKASNVILVYGPSALLVLGIFVTERILRNNIRSGGPVLERLCSILYIPNWIFVALLAISICLAWGYIFFFSRITVLGEFHGLTANEQLSAKGDSIYVSNSPVQVDQYTGRLEYKWIIYSDGLIDEDPDIVFTIVDKALAQDKDQEKRKLAWTDVPIPFEKIDLFSDRKARVYFNRSDRTAKLKYGSEEIMLALIVP